MKAIQQTWKSLLDYLNTTTVYNTTLGNLLLKLFYISSLAFFVVWLLPSERPFEYSNLTVGSVARQEIIAPFTFSIQKTEEELARERQEAQDRILRVFNTNDETGKFQKIKLENFFVELKGFFDANQKAPPAPDGSVTAAVDSFVQQLDVKYNVRLEQIALEKLYEIYERKGLTKLSEHLDRSVKEVYTQGILDRQKKDIPEAKIVVKSSEGVEEEMELERVLEIAQAAGNIYNLLQNIYREGASELEVANALISAFLIPNMTYDQDVTAERKQQAFHDVPKTRGFVYQNQRIIDNHEIVTEDVYRKLVSLSLALQENSAVQDNWHQFKFRFGQFLFALTVLLLTALYIRSYRKEIYRDNWKLGMITLIFMMQFAATSLIIDFTDWPREALPIVLAPMLLAMLLDFGTAFICTVSMSMIMGAVLSNDYTFAFMSIVIGSLAIFAVRHIRKRNQMFRAILYVMIAYLIVDTTFGLLHFESLTTISSDFAILILNALLTPAAVFLIIGVFERVFDITTDVTLLELADLNHQLIKRLSVEAPGTFHHSVVVANLAEAGAQATRSNALLTRVGCYFHDIGKMTKPEYFVENQQPGINKHDNLSPHMSTLILVNHVKAGLELADRYRLPQTVKQFISEHHGTSVISYFYRKAQEMAEDKEINESDFRYPGPKPQSRETAIAMLADTVEAASRALQNPTPQRIRNLVDSLVDQKLQQGQLDDSNLTLKDITRVKEAFIPILTGIHHLRIEYPSETVDKDRKHGRNSEKTSESTGANGDREKRAKRQTANGKNGGAGTTNGTKPRNAPQEKKSESR